MHMHGCARSAPIHSATCMSSSHTARAAPLNLLQQEEEEKEFLVVVEDEEEVKGKEAMAKAARLCES